MRQSTPNLLHSDVEEDLRASVRALLTDRTPPSAVLARCESDEPYDLAVWASLAGELGAVGLHVPEELGGQGASARETAVVMEELGRGVAPVPFLGSAVLATSAVLACATGTREVADLLGRLASGTRGALAVPLSTPPGSAFPGSVRADGTLTGRISTVADALVAEVLIVAAQGSDGPELHAVRADAPGVTVSPVVSLDVTRPVADVVLDNVGGIRLAGPDRAAQALASAMLTGAGLLASEQVGIADWCLEETVRYVRERNQFGRPIGSFQALKHRLADVWLELVSARAAARYAAEAIATGNPDTEVAVAMAQALCSVVAVHAAEECIQLHGGIGMTWEHPAHLYLKRAKANQIALGTPDRHRATLATLVDLPA